MALLAAFSGDSELHRAVTRVLCGQHSVVATTSWARFLTLVRERPITSVVLDDLVLDRAGGVVAAVAELRTRFPSVGCVLVARPFSDPHALLRLGRTRVENLVLVPQDALEEGLARELAKVTRNGTIGLVTGALSPYLPARETLALKSALNAGRYGWSAEDLAERAGLSRPHMSVRLKHAGLPSTGQLLIWARLLHAGRWLTDPGRSAESVSRQLEYSSGAAFRRALRNFTGATPTQVIERGGIDFVLEQFLSVCAVDGDRGAGQSAA